MSGVGEFHFRDVPPPRSRHSMRSIVRNRTKVFLYITICFFIKTMLDLDRGDADERTNASARTLFQREVAMQAHIIRWFRDRRMHQTVQSCISNFHNEAIQHASFVTYSLEDMICESFLRLSYMGKGKKKRAHSAKKFLRSLLYKTKKGIGQDLLKSTSLGKMDSKFFLASPGNEQQDSHPPYSSMGRSNLALYGSGEGFNISSTDSRNYVHRFPTNGISKNSSNNFCTPRTQGYDSLQSIKSSTATTTGLNHGDSDLSENEDLDQEREEEILNTYQSVISNST